MRTAVALVALMMVSTTAAVAASDTIATALASPDRPAADTQRDADRKPGELIAFAGIKPGQRVADLMPGGGYFTRIFSKVVGPTGKVYAMVPAELVQARPTAVDAVNAIAAQPAFGNVRVVVTPTAETAAPEPVDVAWTSDNYHDLYNGSGADQAARFDAAVFRMLRPGGEFIVIDHAAAPQTVTKPLHRIDPDVVRAQVVAAGFVFEGESPVLRNPADTHALPVFDPSLRGHTDQFVFRFRKPMK